VIPTESRGPKEEEYCIKMPRKEDQVKTPRIVRTKGESCPPKRMGRLVEKRNWTAKRTAPVVWKELLQGQPEKGGFTADKLAGLTY